MSLILDELKAALWLPEVERKTCKAAGAVKTRRMDDFLLSTAASKVSQDDVTLSPKP